MTTKIAGVDGCPAGWICLIEEEETKRIGSKIFPTFAELASVVEANVIAIDIPIGLTDSGTRDADREARRYLGQPRGTSVFPAPIRPLLSSRSHAEAMKRSREIDGKGVPAQAFAIYKQIIEVDDQLRARADLRNRVYEVHPEVSFALWSGAPIVPGKRTSEGAAIRRALIDAAFGADAFETVRERYKKKEAADDDILDAFAALWTARRIVAGTARTFPDHPPHDSAGLPMRIVA